MTRSALASAPTRRRLTPGRVLGTLLLVLVACVVLAELVLRFGLGLGTPILVQADPATYYVLKPNQHLRRFFGHVNVNEWSMRATTFETPKPPGTYRVLMVGDSMTYGTTKVDDAKIFTSLLRDELPAQLHKKVEVLNASAGAWAIGNELAYIQSRGIFDADLVVLVINSGDPAQGPAGLESVGGDAATEPYPCALCELWARYLAPDILHIQPKRDAGTMQPVAQETEVSLGLENLQRLGQFQQVVQSHGARMSILFLAMREYVKAGQQTSAPVQFVDWARDHNVPFVDLTGAETRYTPKQITLDGDHLNAEGMRVVATAAEQHWAQLDPALSTH